MSILLKGLGWGFLVMASFAILCVVAFAWARHGVSEVGAMFNMGGGLDAIALTLAFGPGIAILLAGYWLGRRPR